MNQVTARSGRTGNSRFASIPSANIPRSTFDRSHRGMTTMDSGYLVPIFVDEALPADTMNCRLNFFARLATPLKPIMDDLFVDTFFFAVPLRLLWDNFERFMGSQDNPGDSTDFLTPKADTIGFAGYASQSLQDYMGIPPGVPNITHNTFALRAYNLIYNEWFRDENLQDSIPFSTGDGPDDIADYVLRRRGKRHDYFTSCLPFPQKGPAVPLPLGGTAPLGGFASVISTGTPFFANGGTADALSVSVNDDNVRWIGSSTGDLAWGNPNLGASMIASPVPGQEPFADLSAATAATVNNIREAFQIQKLYERDARGGTRYTEIVRSHFGVISDDARLQRPEYLGGGTTAVNVHPVAQTSNAGDQVTPQGNLTAFVTAAAQGHGFVKSFTEHCMIIGLASVRANITYQSGLNRMWSRDTRFDYYWPSFAHLGEQEVLNSEIFTVGDGRDDQVFGYQERYAEYRYKPNHITGKFRSQDPQSLDVWHLAQEFSDIPLLNASFIEENPPVDRVIAVPSEPQWLLDTFFNYKCVRPLPVYSVPGLVDHF